jgi:hypothetical protein
VHAQFYIFTHSQFGLSSFAQPESKCLLLSFRNFNSIWVEQWHLAEFYFQVFRTRTYQHFWHKIASGTEDSFLQHGVHNSGDLWPLGFNHRCIYDSYIRISVTRLFSSLFSGNKKRTLTLIGCRRLLEGREGREGRKGREGSSSHSFSLIKRRWHPIR